MSTTQIALLLTQVMLLGIAGCSANATSGGACERKCGSRTIGGGNITAVALDNPVTIKCSNVGSSIGKTFEYHFLVYEDRTAANKAAAGTGTGTPSTSDSSNTQSVPSALTPDRVPVGGIAIMPSIIGLTQANDDTKGSDTPVSDWCTDSCGVASIKVTPTCAQQDMGVGIIVFGNTGAVTGGTANPNPSVKLTINTQ